MSSSQQCTIVVHTQLLDVSATDICVEFDVPVDSTASEIVAATLSRFRRSAHIGSNTKVKGGEGDPYARPSHRRNVSCDSNSSSQHSVMVPSHRRGSSVSSTTSNSSSHRMNVTVAGNNQNGVHMQKVPTSSSTASSSSSEHSGAGSAVSSSANMNMNINMNMSMNFNAEDDTFQLYNPEEFCLYEACFLYRNGDFPPPLESHLSKKRPSVDSTNSLDSINEGSDTEPMSDKENNVPVQQPGKMTTSLQKQLLTHTGASLSAKLRRLIRRMEDDEYPSVVMNNWEFIADNETQREGQHHHNHHDVEDGSCMHFFLKEISPKAGDALHDIRGAICKRLPLDKLQDRLSKIDFEEIVENRRLNERYKMQRQEIMRRIQLVREQRSPVTTTDC